MLSFEKCKELFDAGLRRESVNVGDLFYARETMQSFCVVGQSEGGCDLYMTPITGRRYPTKAYPIWVVDSRSSVIPIFTLEEILFAIREVSPVGIMVGAHVTIESSCDMYLGIMKMSEIEKPLEIKLGGIYRMRNGGAAMVYAVYKDGAYPVRAIDLGCSIFLALTDAGRYVVSGGDEPVDLVRLIGTVDQIEWEVGMPMWRRKSDGSWVRSIVNETYLELIQEDPYSYVPVYENGRFVRSDVSEAELKRQAFMESMKQW